MRHSSIKHTGHLGFSNFVASDDELPIFKQFRVLGSRNLLYLQSTMLELEQRLEELDEQDTKEVNMDILLSTACWETFSAKAKEFPREAERMEVINRIRIVTKDYCKSIQIPKKRKKSSRASPLSPSESFRRSKLCCP